MKTVPAACTLPGTKPCGLTAGREYGECGRGQGEAFLRTLGCSWDTAQVDDTQQIISPTAVQTVTASVIPAPVIINGVSIAHRTSFCQSATAAAIGFGWPQLVHGCHFCSAHHVQ